MTDNPGTEQPADFYYDAAYGDPAYDDGADYGSPRMDKGQIGVIILVVLAVIASIVMLISGSDAALKLALLASLWAAVLGFFLISRYRWVAAERETELWVREEYYQSELARVSKEVEPVSEAPAKEWAEIKQQLEQIREQLDELAGREYTYEPAALYAEARRIAEIEALTPIQKEPEPAPERVEEPVSFTQPSKGAPSPSAVAGKVGNQNPTRQDNPLSALIKEREERETREAREAREARLAAEEKAQKAATAAAAPSTPDAQPEPKPDTAHTTEPAAKPQPAAVEPEPIVETEPAVEPEPQVAPKPLFDTNSFQSVRWDTGEYPPAADSQSQDKAEKPETSSSQPEQRPVHKHEQPESDRHGRRRSDVKRDGTKSVAQLLAEMKKNK